MLDIRSASVGLREQLLRSSFSAPPAPSAGAPPVQETTQVDSSPESHVVSLTALSSSVESSDSSVLGSLPTMHAPPSRLRISLQDMISTSIALKSGLDLEIVDTPSAPEWPVTLVDHQSRTRSPSRKSVASLSIRSPTPEPTIRPDAVHETPMHVSNAIAGLQREVLMLRSELNFELWMARENVKHIGRLYQDRAVSRFAEVERQGLVSSFVVRIVPLFDVHSAVQ